MYAKPIMTAISAAKLPEKSGENKEWKRKRLPRGVVCLRHIPYGFFEDQMWSYFSQFGEVTRIKLARSKKTGKSRGFAYIEFRYPEVAEIVAQTMNNYLMFEELLKAEYIPPEKQHPGLFQGIYVKTNEVSQPFKISMVPAVRTRKKMKKLTNRKLSDTEELRRKIKATWKIAETSKKLQALGIEYKIPVVDSSDEGSDLEDNDESRECQVVMEVDDSDEEIAFRTPPNVVSRHRRSSVMKLADRNEMTDSDTEPAIPQDGTNSAVMSAGAKDEGPSPKMKSWRKGRRTTKSVQKGSKSGILGVNSNVNFVEAKMMKEELKKWHSGMSKDDDEVSNNNLEQAESSTTKSKVKKVKQKGLPEKKTTKQQRLSKELTGEKNQNSSKSLKVQRKTSQNPRSAAFRRKAKILSLRKSTKPGTSSK